MRRALALLLFVLPLAACGGGGGATSLDPIAQAADKTTNVAGAHFLMSARIGGQGQTIAFSGPGEIADHGKTLHMQMSMPASLLGLKGTTGNSKFDIVSSGGYFYVRGGIFDQFAHGKWVRVKDTNPNFELGQNDPSQMLQYLRATSNVDEKGTETVRGVKTTHYAARIQVDKVASRLSPKAARSLKQMSATLGAKEIPLDVWIDGDGLVRRLKMDWHPNGATLLVSLDLYDFGDVKVAVPAASDTTDLSNLLGGG